MPRAGGVSLEWWVANSPPELHSLHPNHPDNPAREPPTPKPSKYRNKRTEYGGRTYDSKAEAIRAEQLDWEKSAGLIREWTPQPAYHLGCPEHTYRADFEVIGKDGETWTEDVKGTETSKFRQDKRLWRVYGPHPLRVLKRGKETEVIEPQGVDLC